MYVRAPAVSNPKSQDDSIDSETPGKHTTMQYFYINTVSSM